MTRDILREYEHLFIGSRLKRLAERFQADAQRIFELHGYPMQPSQMPLLAAIDRYGPLTVNEAVEALGVSQPAVTRSLASLVALGILETTASSADRRVKTITLTDEGRARIDAMKQGLWPRVADTVAEMCGRLEGALVDQIRQLEDQMTEQSFADRVAAAEGGLRIVEFNDDNAHFFHDINAEWINSMFRMEENDLSVLMNPREAIIDKGGAILFVEAPGLGIVGTGALRRGEDGAYELTKMGVRETARGRKAGEFVLRALIDRAIAMGIEKLYLLTNSACAAAIHLYEKNGFAHDADIMRDYGARYARCDVAMRYRPAMEAAA